MLHRNLIPGDLIKAFEFEPMPDRPDRFVIGAIDRFEEYAYIIKGETIIKDTAFGTERMKEGVEIRVPFTVMFEHEGRVTPLTEGHKFLEAYYAEVE